jgi:hypothetical protein
MQVHIYMTLKFLALQGAPHIYDISRLRVKEPSRNEMTLGREDGRGVTNICQMPRSVMLYAQLGHPYVIECLPRQRSLRLALSPYGRLIVKGCTLQLCLFTSNKPQNEIWDKVSLPMFLYIPSRFSGYM